MNDRAGGITVTREDREAVGCLEPDRELRCQEALHVRCQPLAEKGDRRGITMWINATVPPRRELSTYCFHNASDYGHGVLVAVA
jgi:hypothetical protein